MKTRVGRASSTIKRLRQGVRDALKPRKRTGNSDGYMSIDMWNFQGEIQLGVFGGLLSDKVVSGNRQAARTLRELAAIIEKGV